MAGSGPDQLAKPSPAQNGPWLYKSQGPFSHCVDQDGYHHGHRPQPSQVEAERDSERCCKEQDPCNDPEHQCQGGHGHLTML